MNTKCTLECRVFFLHISLIHFLEFTVDRKIQMHLSQKQTYGRVGPVVHKDGLIICSFTHKWLQFFHLKKIWVYQLDSYF